MKPSTMILGAFAALVSAAPAKEARGFNSNFNANDLSNFGFNSFNSLDFQYLSVVNGLDFNLLIQLAQLQNFNLGQFGNLFGSNVFDLNSLLQFQQLATLIQLSSLGVFGGFDLNDLLFNSLNFGLINNALSFDFGGIIDQSLVPQLSAVVQQGSE